MNTNSWQFKFLEFYGLKLPHPGQWRVHRSLRERLGVRLNDNLKVVRDGHLWLLNPSDYVQEEFFWLGTRDTWDIYHLKKLLRPRSVLFDIGANFGHYSVTLADALQRECKVYAFEPHPANLHRLRTNISLNHLEEIIEVCPVGLSDAAGSGSMTVRSDNSGSATLAQTESADGIDVELTTLDEFSNRRSIDQCSFIKIDVEGFEEKVLRGGEQLIRKYNPLIFIELDPPKLERAGSSVDRVVGLLGDFGYKLFIASRRQLIPLQVLPHGDELLNAICMPLREKSQNKPHA